MKRNLFVLALIFSLIFLFSCASYKTDKNDKIQIVCTSFAQYDWVREIVGENTNKFDIVYLCSNGVDFHSYQPSFEDIAKISECELLITVGAASEEWVYDALENSKDGKKKHIRLTDVVAGDLMYIDEEHDDHHHSSVDEHVWLSLKNAQVFCRNIAQAISELDKDSAEYYFENTERYIGELSELDRITSEFIKSAPRDTVVFADRFAFRYTLRDYGVKCFSAFDGCSSDSEVSFETIAFLSQKIDELGLRTILTADGSNKKIAKAVSLNTKTKDQQISELDSMQSVSLKDIKNGQTYISVMKNNLALIHSALCV